MNEKKKLQHTIDENLSLQCEKKRLQNAVNVLSAAYGSLVSGAGGFIKEHYKNNYRSVIHKRNKAYPFIPYSPYAVVEQLYVAFNRLGGYWNKYRFLDAGCGIGNIMLLADKAGFDTHGLEIDPTILAMANKINKNMFFKMEKQNIMTYKNYNDYDVIYYFCPYAVYIKEKRFEERVENEMKVGAIVIPNFKTSKKIEKDDRFESIMISVDRIPIYIKIKA